MVVIGAFLNKQALADFLMEKNMDTLILCAGWKGKFNLEDTLFAGAMVEALQGRYHPSCDAPIAARTLYLEAKKDLSAYLSDSSHVQRLKRLNIEKDITYCLQENRLDCVPVLKDGEIVKFN